MDCNEMTKSLQYHQKFKNIPIQCKIIPYKESPDDQVENGPRAFKVAALITAKPRGLFKKQQLQHVKKFSIVQI